MSRGGPCSKGAESNCWCADCVPPSPTVARIDHKPPRRDMAGNFEWVWTVTAVSPDGEPVEGFGGRSPDGKRARRQHLQDLVAMARRYPSAPVTD